MQSFMLISLLLAGACLAEIEIGNYLNNFNDVPLVKKRCEEKGKPDSYDRLKVAVNDTRTCFDGKVNPGHLKDELEEAKKTGSMDEVFGKYCNKRQQYKDCILKTVNVAKECLEESESSAIDTLIRITDNVLDFACYRDGDRLAMFVAEGGPECVTSRTEQIKNCINATLKIDTTNLTLENIPENLPTLTINKEKCDKLVEVQECVVKDLETNCKDTTPANIVEALFKFVKKTACNNIKQKRSMLDYLL
ncbi:hypothetical protein ABEB36_010347 [Hypothenemus hampei]|uniref:Uncharacterized protein n=1 Tax=Hypothenemus hampei TaxID=57062 RepID=A0ABD1EJE6_HYPHA